MGEVGSRLGRQGQLTMAKREKGRVIPAPATQVDMYLAAIVEELERLNDTIEGLTVQPEAEVTDEVELREPELPKKAAHRDAKKG